MLLAEKCEFCRKILDFPSSHTYKSKTMKKISFWRHFYFDDFVPWSTTLSENESYESRRAAGLACCSKPTSTSRELLHEPSFISLQGSQMWPQRVLINSGPSSGIKEFSNPDLLRTLLGSLPGPISLKVKVFSTYFELRCAALALLAPFYYTTI